MKYCSRCKEDKHKADFRKDNSKPDGLSYACKMCLNAIYKERYTDRYQENALRHAKLRHKKHRGQIDDLLEDKQCIVCGENETCALVFHHLNEDEKEFTIAGNYQRAWKHILNEIEKCVILCANCHQKYHWGSLKTLNLLEMKNTNNSL